ncbi:FUSC family protein [Streptomyces sp. NPDC052109]|uniref:FUSC family protein n=1 Tax=Streptomyces sp. NPDC052109 TaxID=3155527 RepID=UPI00343A706A
MGGAHRVRRGRWQPGPNGRAAQGVERFAGATAGTLPATGVAATGITGEASVAVMFVILTVALWLRPLNYAYWAAGMTTALSLLLGYFGQNATELLPARLAGTAVGAGRCAGRAATASGRSSGGVPRTPRSRGQPTSTRRPRNTPGRSRTRRRGPGRSVRTSRRPMSWGRPGRTRERPPPVPGGGRARGRAGLRRLSRS